MADYAELEARLRACAWNETATSDDAAISAAYEASREAADAIATLRRERDEAHGLLNANEDAHREAVARIAALEAEMANKETLLRATLEREVASQARHDAKLDALEAENARLREALVAIVGKYPDNPGSDGDNKTGLCVSYAELRRARAALGAGHE